VPGAASTRPLYDVVVTDTLDANLDYLGFTQTSGPAITDQSVAPGLSFRVAQIPAGQQASSRCAPAFARPDRPAGRCDQQHGLLYIFQHLGRTRTARAVQWGRDALCRRAAHNDHQERQPDHAAAGETVRYSVTLTASGTTYSSDVFDVTLTDTLALGLVYAGNPAVTVGGGVSANNTIGAPVLTGDGPTRRKRFSGV